MRIFIFLSALIFVLTLAGIGQSYVMPWTALFVFCAACLIHVFRQGDKSGPGVKLFLACLTVYLSSFRWHGGDDIPNSFLPYCILGHGTLTFDPFVSWAQRDGMRDLIRFLHGHWFSTYPVAPGLLALPLYILPVLLNVVPTDEFLHNLAKIAGASLTALSVVVCFWIARKRCGGKWALASALSYAFGTYAFSVSSQALYSHGPAQLGVALGLWGMLTLGTRAALWSGLGFGLAVVSREDSLFFLLAAGLFYAFHRREDLGLFCLSAAVPVSLNLAYWYACTGGFYPPYYSIQSEMFGAFNPEALAANLFSPSRGLLFFFPGVVFALWGAFLEWRDPRRRWVPYMLAACLGLWIFYGYRQSWTGGNTYGNRYFSVVCMILVLSGIELEKSILSSRKLLGAWTVMFAWSVAVHAVGAYFNWPSANATLGQQTAVVWDIAQFPLVHLFSSQGALGPLSQETRWFLASCVILLSFPIGFAMYRYLRSRQDSQDFS